MLGRAPNVSGMKKEDSKTSWQFDDDEEDWVIRFARYFKHKLRKLLPVETKWKQDLT